MNKALQMASSRQELSMIEVMTALDARVDLGRPKESAKENGIHFMESLQER